jgi:hypothetical protein
MKNIFFLYIPPGNQEAILHYNDTINKRVLSDRIFKFVDSNLKNKLINIFDNKPIAVWGSRDSNANRSKFERMKPGDDILIVEGDTVKLLGKIADKTVNPALSRELWKNIKPTSTEGWDLIYFIANPLEINLPFSKVKDLFTYSPDYYLRGFTNVSENKLTEFYSKYDDLYSILQRIKSGEGIVEKKNELIDKELKKGKDELQHEVEDIEQELPGKILSDHLLVQWKLIQLGIKAGSKVWIPKNDQSRIIKEYQFNNFENSFIASLDTPAKYVENIDVVWKEEFRIDAAFEIENTTSIYSGLLRFSDLKIIAPNSNYPLFIVAPYSNYNRLVAQIKRPTFRELGFEKKVRYLSYESINEMDKFFEDSTEGLNVDVLIGKSKQIQ